MTAPRSRFRAGFTLMEVLIAAVMLAVGCIAILSCMMQCQRMMLASKRFESAQLVLQLGDMAHPIPDPSQVTTTLNADGTATLSVPRQSASQIFYRIETIDN